MRDGEACDWAVYAWIVNGALGVWDVVGLWFLRLFRHN